MDDVIGFVRVNLPRYTAVGQRRAMAMHNIRNIIQKGERIRLEEIPEGMTVALGDIADVLRMAVEGRTVAVLHAHLLANPERRNVRGALRKDFWRVFDALEAKGTVLWELYTDLRSDDPAQRDKMTRAAVDALALGRHKTRRSDKRGRPKKEFDEPTKLKGQQVWESRRYKSWKVAAKHLPKGMTVWDAYELFGPRNTEEE